MSIQGVGWLCGAFSNPEPFNTAAAQTFVTAGNQVGMGISFVYPGNAKNSMLEDTGFGGQDSQYIERTMLAAIYGHGNVFGPDVEYVPHAAIMQFPWHKWGDLGVLRWVFISGCDALGFPVDPSGHAVANSDQAPPMRWNGTLAGISGMCGYRSESWYVPGFQAMMPLSRTYDVGIMQVGSGYAQTLVNQMSALNTFWGSWVQAAAWLHGQLNRQAQPVCFVNRSESLGEHLKNYLWDRRSNLDVPSIQWTTVGSGTAPVYEPGYCPTCDANGHATCPPSPAFEATKIGKLDVTGHLDFEGPEDLPIFEYTVDAEDLAFADYLGQQLLVPGLANILASSDSASGTVSRGASTNFSAWGLSPATPDKLALIENLSAAVAKQFNKADGHVAHSGFETSILGPSISRTSSSAWINLGDKKLPVLLDNGIALWDSYGTRALYGSIWHVVSKTGSRQMPKLADVLGIATLAQAPSVHSLHVEDVQVAYVKSGGAFGGQLIPTLQVSLIAKTHNGTRQAMVLLG